MQILAILSKSTKQGVSTFRFVQTENNELWMFGGASPKAIQFKTRKELDRCVMTWVNYGYQFGLVPTQRPARPEWDKPETKSQLPTELQQDLWALQPSVA